MPLGVETERVAPIPVVDRDDVVDVGLARPALLLGHLPRLRSHRASSVAGYVLGRFDAILQGSGELPGYGISLWTFWHTRQQMIETYGPHGAATLIGTAEVVNLFNLPAAEPDEIEHWSKAIGTYTGVRVATARDPQTGRVTEARTPEAVRLVPAADLPGWLHQWQVVFLTSRFHTANPLKLRRTSASSDQRFHGHVDLPAPVGRTA